MTQHQRKRAAPPPKPPKSASTADGIVAQRAALAERERQTAEARTAARRLRAAAEPRP